MIQRPQHLFMTLSALLSLVSYYLLGKENPKDLLIYVHYALLLPIPFTIGNIFIYKQPKKQKIIQIMHLFLADLILAALILLLVMHNLITTNYIIIIITTAMTSVFSGLAFAFILKDIRLLESVDRIR